MGIQERISKYLEIKGITPYRFCKDLGFSMGYLDKKGAIGTDKYLKIIKYYSDLNPTWLLTGEGEMLKSSQNNKDSLTAGGVPYWNLPVSAGKSVTDIIGGFTPDGYIQGLPGADKTYCLFQVQAWNRKYQPVH